MSEDTTGPFTFRVEISPEHVDAIAPRLREALAASGNDGGRPRSQSARRSSAATRRSSNGVPAS